MRLQRSVSSLLALLAVSAALGDDWPEWRGRGRRGEYHESGIVEKFPASGLKVKWRTPIHAGYTGPAVAGGRVFVTDFRMVAPGEGPPAPPEMSMRRATGLIGVERALAVEEATGKIIWTREWDADYTGTMQSYAIGPRATPTVDGDRVYVQTTMGALLCLNAATGKVLWRKNYQEEFGLQAPIWGMTAAPLVDGPRVIAVTGGKDGSLVAFDKLSGEVRWKAVPAGGGPGYSSPFLMEAGGARQLVYWHAQGVASVDPAGGQLLWQQEWRQTSTGLVIATPVQAKNWLLLSSFYKGSLMMELDAERPAAKMLWKGASESEIDTDGLHSITSTPVIDGNYIYGVCSYGQFRCLDARTGKRVWETQAVTKEKARWASAFLVRHGDRYFINNDRGELIIARLSPKGYDEVSRTTLIKPTATAGIGRRELKAVNWTHPAYANRTLYTRNDEELIAVSLSQ